MLEVASNCYPRRMSVHDRIPAIGQCKCCTRRNTMNPLIPVIYPIVFTVAGIATFWYPRNSNRVVSFLGGCSFILGMAIFAFDYL